MSGAGIREEKDGWRQPGDLPAPHIGDVRRWLAEWLDGRAVRELALLPGGLMNRNCRLHIDGSPDVVLRLYDRNPSIAGTELAVLQALRGEVPVPRVLYSHTDHAAADPPFLLLELVDGIALSEVRRSGDRDAVAASACDAGRVLARLQSRRFEAAGLLTPSLEVDRSRLPDPLTPLSIVEHFVRTPRFEARVDPRRRATLLAMARDWDEHPTAPLLANTLVHGDFNSRNVFVNQTDGIWRLSAVLDWEFAFAGPAYIDIGNFLRYERPGRPRFEPWFSRGLREGGLALEGDWQRAARMADLPALCELLARESTPDDVVTEVVGLVDNTIGQP